MSDTIPPARIDADGIYHDGEARLLLGVTDSAMRRARQSGDLRYSRQGTRIIYRGLWLTDWLDRTAEGGD